MQTESKLDADMLGYMMFRLLFGTQDDRYEPETAAPLLRALHKLDDESAAVSIKLHAMDAEGKWSEN
jgi:hypothetical protein